MEKLQLCLQKEWIGYNTQLCNNTQCRILKQKNSPNQEKKIAKTIFWEIKQKLLEDNVDQFP
jgi:hypothetical protein